ncbi:hypothetical protein [Nocardia cyriacigeorgica]|uniref:hypothetical protein n=1 Tax=Nocardia cyriacigeorgica TaxID=135487 RepID=UPI0020173F6B|nr:hypothetical protein [Nocardia cyriacigeorgica]
MTATAEPDGLAEFAAELKLLAEAVLERVEPVLRRAAADGKPEWDNCSWCPVCAAAALVRGEQHDVLSAIADHGTAIVTVLREALAGVPVEPVMPDGTEPGVRHRHHAGRPEDAARQADTGAGAVPQDSEPESEAGAGAFEFPGDPADEPTRADARAERSRFRGTKAETRRRAARTNIPADAVRDDIRSGGAPHSSGPAPDATERPGTAETSRSGGHVASRSGATEPGAGNATTATEPSGGTRTRSRYVGIPVTIKT